MDARLSKSSYTADKPDGCSEPMGTARIRREDSRTAASHISYPASVKRAAPIFLSLKMGRTPGQRYVPNLCAFCAQRCDPGTRVLITRPLTAGCPNSGRLYQKWDCSPAASTLAISKRRICLLIRPFRFSPLLHSSPAWSGIFQPGALELG